MHIGTSILKRKGLPQIAIFAAYVAVAANILTSTLMVATAGKKTRRLVHEDVIS